MPLDAQSRSCHTGWTVVVRSWLASVLARMSVSQAAAPDEAAPTTQPAPSNGGNVAEAPEAGIREQSICIPCTKLRESFEREGRGMAFHQRVDQAGGSLRS
jgi:hypothetical protein